MRHGTHRGVETDGLSPKHAMRTPARGLAVASTPEKAEPRSAARLPPSASSASHSAMHPANGKSRAQRQDAADRFRSQSQYQLSISGECIVPERDKDSHQIVALPERAFVRRVALTSISLPTQLKTIGSFAFAGCTSLKSVKLQDGLRSIGRCAFAGCSSLATADLPASVTTIGPMAFHKCSSLLFVTLPAGLVQLEVGTFAGCSALLSVDCAPYPRLAVICDRAFAGCSALAAISLPASTTTLGSRAFDGCQSLTNAVTKLPLALQNLGTAAFAHCPRITGITLPAGLETHNIRSLRPLLMPEASAGHGAGAAGSKLKAHMLASSSRLSAKRAATPPRRQRAASPLLRRPSMPYDECRAALRQLAKEHHTQHSNVGITHVFSDMW